MWNWSLQIGDEEKMSITQKVWTAGFDVAVIAAGMTTV